MTGEVTLTGRVLPVGGVREKILAARRAGIKSVLLPRHNEKDLVDIPAEVKADLTLRLVDTLDDVVARLFESRPRATRTPPQTLGKPTLPLGTDQAGRGGRKEGPVLDPKSTRTEPAARSTWVPDCHRNPLAVTVAFPRWQTAVSVQADA